MDRQAGIVPSRSAVSCCGGRPGGRQADRKEAQAARAAQQRAAMPRAGASPPAQASRAGPAAPAAAHDVAVLLGGAAAVWVCLIHVHRVAHLGSHLEAAGMQGCVCNESTNCRMPCRKAATQLAHCALPSSHTAGSGAAHLLVHIDGGTKPHSQVHRVCGQQGQGNRQPAVSMSAGVWQQPDRRLDQQVAPAGW